MVQKVAVAQRYIWDKDFVDSIAYKFGETSYKLLILKGRFLGGTCPIDYCNW